MPNETPHRDDPAQEASDGSPSPASFDDPRLESDDPAASPDEAAPRKTKLPPRVTRTADPSDAFDDQGPSKTEDHVGGRFYRTTHDPDIHEKHVPGRRVKKRRKNRKGVPEWDRGADAEDGAEEGSNDDGFGVEDTPPKRRRRKRRKSLSKSERLFLLSPKVFTAILVVVAAAIVVAAVIIAPTLGLKSNERARQASLESARLDAAAQQNSSLFSTFLTHETEEKVRQTLDRYFAATPWEKKLQFVRRPDEVRPIMAEHYGRPENTDTASSISEVMFRKQLVIGNRTFVMFAVMLRPDLEVRFCAVEKVDDDTFKVDWEVTEAYQPMPLEEFKNLKPSNPKPFRVYAQEDDYYNGPFASEQEFRSYRLTYPGNPDFQLYGYVERGTLLEKQLEAILPSSAASSLILNLRYPEETIDPQQVVIDSIEHTSWFK